jgi:hypothetical protein
MFTAGVLIVACLAGALTLVALLPGHRVGWVGALLGLSGLWYSFAAYPERIILVVFPLSVLLLVLACAARTLGNKKRPGP